MKNEMASVNLNSGPPFRAWKRCPFEFEGSHEVADHIDLGVGKDGFVEFDGLGDVVVEPEEGGDGGGHLSVPLCGG
jgi:hypothetical protein